MDRRVIAITIALIAAIAVPLCASSGWARGLGVLGMMGGGAAAVPVCDDGLLSNGCFDDGTTGWTAYANATLSVDGGALTVTGGATDFPGAIYGEATPIGVSYTMTMTITSNPDSVAIVRFIGNAQCGAAISAPGQYSCTATATGWNGVTIRTTSTSDTVVYSIDNIKVVAN